MERHFFSQKEKQHSSANDAAKDTVVVTSPAVDELVIAVGNTKDVNVGQTPISSIVDLNSEDVGNVPVWVKLYGVHVMAFNDDGLNVIATKLGTPLMLDSYTHVQNECFKRIGSDVAKNLKNPTQAPRGVPVSTKSRKEVSNPNPFDVLNSVENDVDLGTNGTNTTPIVGNIDKLGRLIIDGKLTLVDDEDKPLEKVEYLGDHDSEDEVELIDNEMASFLQRGLAMVLIVCWNSERKLMRMPIMTTPHTMMICMKARKFLTTFNQYAIILISRYEVVKRNRLLEIVESFVV
ncbi:hypothetical protein Tco_1244701 [Tanacetum coccineum]